MTWKRKDPGAVGAAGTSESVIADGLDASELTLPTQISQARRRARANFARQMVFEEFRFKHARALDYDGFVDRKPSEPPRPSPEVWRFAWEVGRAW